MFSTCNSWTNTESALYNNHSLVTPITHSLGEYCNLHRRNDVLLRGSQRETRGFSITIQCYTYIILLATQTEIYDMVSDISEWNKVRFNPTILFNEDTCKSFIFSSKFRNWISLCKINFKEYDLNGKKYNYYSYPKIISVSLINRVVPGNITNYILLYLWSFVLSRKCQPHNNPEIMDY